MISLELLQTLYKASDFIKGAICLKNIDGLPNYKESWSLY